MGIGDLLLEKEKLLKEMLECTRDLGKALEKEEEEKVLEILERRGQLMKEVDVIDEKLANIGGQAEFEAEIESHREIVRTLIKEDEENKKKAEGLRNKYASEILKLKKTGDAMQSYGISERPSREGAFIDTKE